MMVKKYLNGNNSVLVKQRIQTNMRKGAILTVSMALLVSPLVAAAPTPAVNNSANTLKVSPVRSDIEVPAGTSKTVQTTITNLTRSPITVTPIENDFVAGDERGTPALILDSDKYAPTHSLKRFMRPLQNITIDAHNSRTVDVVITVPKNAQAGGYFGAIRFAPAAPDGGGQVNLSASVASLILMTVPGPTTEKLDLTSFDIQQDGKSSSTFFQTPDNLKIAVRFKNSGNVQLGPFGKLSVKQGDKVIYSTDFNSNTPKDMVLPDSARRWDIPLDKIGTFGHYQVSATFTYGSKNQTIEVTKSFWVVPMYIIIAAIVGFVVLILVIIGIWLFLRSYKRRVLRSQNRGGRYRR